MRETPSLRVAELSHDEHIDIERHVFYAHHRDRHLRPGKQPLAERIDRLQHPVTDSGSQLSDALPLRRHGNAVILEPIAMNWGWLDEVLGPVDEDFAQAAAEQPGEQSRPALDVFR